MLAVGRLDEYAPRRKSGTQIVLEAFRAAPGRRLTNIELGGLYGVQAFRSRISDLRRQGHEITQGRRLQQGVYEYRLIEPERTEQLLLEPSDPGETMRGENTIDS